MENNKASLIVAKRIQSPRLWMKLSTVITLLSSAIIIYSHILGGYSFKYFIFPIIMGAVDIAYLVLSFLVNYRFAKTEKFPIIYLAVSFVLTVVAIMIDGGSNGTSLFTHLAIYSFLGVHLLSIIAGVICYLHASKVTRSRTKIGVVALVLTIVLGAATFAYGAFVFVNGWFGQGAVGVERPLEYSLTEDGLGYKVTGMLSGRGDTVVVPTEFNGKPVTAVDCAIFETELIKNIYFEGDLSYENLDNPKFLYSKAGDRVVYAKNCDGIRNGYFLNAFNAKNKQSLEIANIIVPYGLEDGQVYVTFTYTYADLLAAKGEGLKTWIGKKGTTITEEALNGVSFVKYKFDADKPQNNQWAYNNTNKMIYKGASFEDGAGFGKDVSASINNVTLSFEKLYMVNLKEDNDTVYEVEDSFKYYNVEDKISNVFTKAQAIAWFDSYATREGFDLAWLKGNDENKVAFAGMSENLADGMNIYPQWTMKTPTITSINSNGTIVYGQDAQFNSSATAAKNDFNLTYEWTFNGSSVSTDKSFTITNALPSQSGTYTLKVVSSSAGVSSLTSETVATADVVINKRGITIDWTLPDNPVYTAEDKTVSWTPNSTVTETEGVINGDAITFENSDSSSIRNVGVYSYDLVLNGACADLYYIKENKTNSYTITPATLDAVWGELEFVYNGYNQAPTATATGLGTDGTITLTIEGNGKNAGTHTITAVSPDKNYVISDSSKEATMKITPYEINVDWSHTSDLVYDGTLQAPSATAPGLGEDGTIKFSVSGAVKDAGTGYDAIVEATDGKYLDTTGNYVANLSTIETEFSIAKRPITLTWNYGGKVTYMSSQYVYAIKEITNAVKDERDNITFTYVYTGTSDKNIAPNKIGSYTVSVQLAEDSSDADVNKNYEIASETTFAFEIEKRELNLVWTGTGVTFDNTEKTVNVNTYGIDPTLPTYDEMVAEILSELKYVNNKQTNAGTYEATVSLVNGENANFAIKTGDKYEYTIKQRAIALTWDSAQGLIYNGQKQTVFALTDDDVANAEGLDTIISYDTEATKTNAGSYETTVTVTDDNYVISTGKTCKYSIAKRVITASWALKSERDFIFDGKEWAWNVDFGNVVSGEVPTYAVTFTVTNDTAPVNVGSYIATVALGAEAVNNNYSIDPSTVDHSFTVNKKAVTIKWEDLNFTYDGTAHVPVAYFMDVNNSRVTVAVDGSQTNASSTTYQATAKPTDTNYDYSSTTNQFRINPMPVSIVWEDTSFIFNGKEQKPTATMKNYLTSEAVNLRLVEVKLSGTSDGKNAGKHTVIASLDSNYEIRENQTKQYDIAQKNVDVVWDGIYEFVFNGKNQAPSATFFDVNSAEITLTVVGAATDVGSYTATASTTDKNYKLSNTEASFEIVGKPVDVIWEKLNLVYNGVEQRPVAYFTGVSGRVNLTVVGSLVDVGSTSVTVSFDDTNYVLNTSTTTNTFTVKPKDVSVLWGNNKFTFNGENQVPSASFLNVKNETVTLTVNGAEVNAGNGYTATAVCNDDNYKLLNPTTSFSIGTKQVAITWENTEFTFDGNAHKPDAYFEDVNGHKVYVTVAGEQTNARTTAYTATASHDDKNYTLTNTSCQFTISPKTVNAVWENTEFTYDGKSHQPTAYYLDVKGERVNLTVSGGKTNASSTPYSATASGRDANYKVEGTTTTFVILPLDVVIEWSNLDLIYNGAQQKPSATVKTLEDMVTSLATPVVTVVSGTNGKDVGAHNAKVSLGTNFNIVSGEEVRYTISPLSVTVVWENTTLSYNGKVQAPSAYFNGVSGKVTVTVEGDSNAINVGSYNATASYTKDNNYTLTNESTSYEIVAKEVTVAWTNTNLVYNGSAQAPSAFFMDVDNRKVNLIASGAQTNAGSWTATTSHDDSNYELSNTSMTFTIAKQEISVQWSNDGDVLVPSVSGVDSSVYSVSYAKNGGSTSAAKPTEAGTYTVTITIENENYTFSAGSVTERTFTIEDSTIGE